MIDFIAISLWYRLVLKFGGKMMKIIDKSSHASVTEYSVGDVIQDSVSVYMIVQISLNGYVAIDLGRGVASDICGSLEELYHETHINGERKVKATVVIEEEENKVSNSIKLQEKSQEDK